MPKRLSSFGGSMMMTPATASIVEGTAVSIVFGATTTAVESVKSARSTVSGGSRMIASDGMSPM